MSTEFAPMLAALAAKHVLGTKQVELALTQDSMNADCMELFAQLPPL